MNLDIPVAGWILSVIAFVAGTIIPMFYRRFIYEGVAIKQPVLFHGISAKQKGMVTFITRVKIANAQKDSILLDEIRLPRIVIENIVFNPAGNIQVDFPKPNEYHVPLSSNPHFIPEYLPLIIKADEEKFVDFEFDYLYKPDTASDATKMLSKYVSQKGLPVAFRVNGKYRDYVLRLPPMGAS